MYDLGDEFVCIDVVVDGCLVVDGGCVFGVGL